MIVGSSIGHESSPRGDRRRAQILSAAIQLFGEVGYRATSLRDIAARVGITHPGLLYHFHSKEELLQAVLAQRDEDDAARFHVHDDDATALAQLRGLLDVVAHNASRRGMVELFSTLSAEATDVSHPARAYFAQRYRTLVESNTALFRRLAEEGLLREGVEPASAARALVALMDGLQVQWLYAPTGLDMAADVTRYLDAVLVLPLAELDPRPR